MPPSKSVISVARMPSCSGGLAACTFAQITISDCLHSSKSSFDNSPKLVEFETKIGFILYLFNALKNICPATLWATKTDILFNN